MDNTDQAFLAELQRTFEEESHRNASILASGLAAIGASRDAVARKASFDAMHRAAHTIKGSARALKRDSIGSLCQSMEDIFGLMRQGVLNPTLDVLTALQRATDALPRLIAAAPERDTTNVAELIAPLAAIAAPEAGAPTAPPKPAPAFDRLPAQDAHPTEGAAPSDSASAGRRPLAALIIEDSEFDALFLLALLRQGGYEVRSRRVQDAASLSAALTSEHWDIVFSDHRMPNFDSTEALRIVKATRSDIPFIIVSGSIGEDVAVAAMKAGAQDYLMKGNLTRLVAAVERELQDAKDRQARREAERALLAQQEALRIAREVQEHLFPPRAPAIPGFDIAGATRPAEATGGDYYDFIRASSDRTFIVVGDVSGHGLGPALLMADVRAYLRALARDHADIRDMLDQANRLLRDDLGDFRFITMLFASLSSDTRRLRYLNAGHPAGYVLDGHGRVKAELASSSAALGLARDMKFPKAVEVRLEPADTVVLLTDGALEATSPGGEEFGLNRVLDLVRRERHRPASEIISALFDEVRRFSAVPELRDDLSAVIIKVCDRKESPP